MVKQNREVLFIAFILFTFTLVNCSEEFVPQGLYDYQVSRLLSTDSNILWTVTEITVDDQFQSLENCEDSLFLLFTSVDDSLFIQSLTRNCIVNNVFDTVDIGQAAPSSFGIIFSDSLIFRDEKVWFIRVITSENSELYFLENNVNVTYNLTADQ